MKQHQQGFKIQSLDLDSFQLWGDPPLSAPHTYLSASEARLWAPPADASSAAMEGLTERSVPLESSAICSKESPKLIFSRGRAAAGGTRTGQVSAGLKMGATGADLKTKVGFPIGVLDPPRHLNSCQPTHCFLKLGTYGRRIWPL